MPQTTDFDFWFIGAPLLHLCPILPLVAPVVAVDAPAAQEFEVGDRWTFHGLLPYGPAQMADCDRDTEYRSGLLSGPVTVTFDLGDAQTPTALVLYDHNLTAAAELRLQASNLSDFSVLTVDDAVPVNPDKILHYIGDPPRTARYWRLWIRDDANPVGYVRWSEAYLGPYTELQLSYALGDLRRQVPLPDRQQSASGRRHGAHLVTVEEFDLQWLRLSVTDRDTLVALHDRLMGGAGEAEECFGFNPDRDDLSDVVLCVWVGQLEAQSQADALGRYMIPVQFAELPRTI
jgi:hypothetical protein